MMRQLRLAATALAALAAALVAGFFYAYHCSVMVGFAAADAVTAISAMQAINATVRNPTFAFSFFGPLGFGVLASLLALPAWRRPSSWAIWAGVALYLIGGFGITMVFNVPLNQALAPVQPAADTAAAIWRDYADPWRFWNAVRTLGSILALIAFVWALRLDAGETRPA